MNDLIGAFYCIGVMAGRTYQLGECTATLTESGEKLNALILENDRLRAKIDRLTGEVRYPREEYPR